MCDNMHAGGQDSSVIGKPPPTPESAIAGLGPYAARVLMGC